MNKKDKDLLLKDLCARLPYGVKCQYAPIKEDDFDYQCDFNIRAIEVDGSIIPYKCGFKYNYSLETVRPYLRPMSSMTEEERIEFSKLLVKRYCEEDCEGHISTSYRIEIDNVYTDDENGIKYPSSFSMDAIDWLNAHHFDYRGLIEKGLALEAPEGMYN